MSVCFRAIAVGFRVLVTSGGDTGALASFRIGFSPNLPAVTIVRLDLAAIRTRTARLGLARANSVACRGGTAVRTTWGLSQFVWTLVYVVVTEAVFHGRGYAVHLLFFCSIVMVLS